MLEALWLHQSLDDVDVPLLKQLLTCPEPRARAAATRVLCYWRDRVSDPLELLRKQVNDEHPRVRLEAIRALSFFDGDQVAKAQEIALESLVLSPGRLPRIHAQRDQQDARSADQEQIQVGIKQIFRG